MVVYKCMYRGAVQTRAVRGTANEVDHAHQRLFEPTSCLRVGLEVDVANLRLRTIPVCLGQVPRYLDRVRILSADRDS